MNSRGRVFQILVLTLVHFSVDFYGGLTIPLPEPTLTGHLATGLPVIALMVGGCALLINIIQPVSQWLLPRNGAPLLLLVTPLMACSVALIGLSTNYAVVTAMFIVSAIGIGIVHPEAALAAHSLAGRHKGLGLSLFIAGGYLGFSLGSLASGLWTEAYGLARFWLLALPASVTAALVVMSRLHRIQGHIQDDSNETTRGTLPVGLVLALALAIAVNICMLTRFLPILFVRSFPGMDPQGWSGTTVFATGVSGIVGMFLWGHISERAGIGRTIAFVVPAGMPFLWMLLHVTRINMAPLWAAGVGFTLGAVFPLCVVLVRDARGLPQRLRMGLAIGGAWGTGELIFIMGGRYIGRFPAGTIEPVETLLHICWFCTIAATVLATIVARSEKGLARSGRSQDASGGL